MLEEENNKRTEREELPKSGIKELEGDFEYEDLTQKEHRRMGGAFDMLARILRGVKKIRFSTGTTMEDRVGKKEMTAAGVNRHSESDSVLEIYQKRAESNRYNFISLGAKASNEEFNTNTIKINVDTKEDENDSANGLFSLSITKNGVDKYGMPGLDAGINLIQSSNTYNLETGEYAKNGATVLITASENGQVQLTHTKGNGYTSAFIISEDGVEIIGLPTSQPSLPNIIWNDGGTLKITS